MSEDKRIYRKDLKGIVERLNEVDLDVRGGYELVIHSEEKYALDFHYYSDMSNEIRLYGPCTAKELWAFAQGILTSLDKIKRVH